MNLIEWWNLVPDQSILTSGGNTDGDLLNLAARHSEGKWIIVYLAKKSTFSVDLSKLNIQKKVEAYWIDPVTGIYSPAGSFKASGEKSFVTPDTMEDSILILQEASQ
jgi:hypothetical protein